MRVGAGFVPDGARGVVEPGDNVVRTNVKDGALRLSMSFFNTEDDLDRVLYAIRREASGK